jgi:hypothetical protein
MGMTMAMATDARRHSIHVTASASSSPVPRVRWSWGKRSAAALCAAGVGLLAITHSLALMTVRTDPVLARQIAPYDGQITAVRALSIIVSQPTGKDQAATVRLAQAALRHEPTAIPAVVTLGLAAQARGWTVSARRWFDCAEMLSRRDSQTQLWMIEDAVARGDIAATLRHYDVALRATPSLAPVLYPILVTASADPQIRAALAQTLARRPAWSDSFANFLAANATDPRTPAELFVTLHQTGAAVPDPARIGTINALVARGLVDDAWRYYAIDHPRADRHRSRDPRFAAGLAPTVFDWVPANEVGISSAIQRGPEGGVFDFSAPASVGGVLLRQAQILPSGTYRLSGHSVGIDQVESARPYWQITCADGRELGRVVMPNSSQDNGTFTGTFQVPANCSVQTLSLVARPSDAISGLTGRVDRVILEPMR